MAEYPQPDTVTESRIKSKAPLREKAGEELREFIVLTAYLYICFAAVIYFKAAVLQAHDVAYAHVGLAIVKAIMTAHGGGIEVVSRPGRGSTFTFSLPANDEPTDEGENGEV